MGMSIDEALKEVNRVILCLTDGGNVTKEVNALEIAIETIRKYQKIQKIMDELNGNFYGSYLNDRRALEKIYEVIEDGKID